MLSKSVRLAAGQRVRLPSGLSPIVSLLFGHCVRLVFLLSPVLPPFLSVTVSALSLVCLLVSTLSPSCLPLSRVLSPFLLVTVSGLSPFCLLLFPFLSL